MAFVDAVARAHSGSVEVENCRTGGAQIRVSLPLASVKMRDALTTLARSG
jgi:signal transduction histidine kinase